MPTTVTQATTSSVATHHIDWGGLAGVIFWLILASLVVFVMGFATPGWSIAGNQQLGLWERCTCGQSTPDKSWFKGTQAMAILALLALVLACVLAFVYMFLHKISKTTTLIAMTVLQFVAVLFMIIAFILFGTNVGDQSYSFAFCVIASIMTFVAGILSVMQLLKAR